MPSIEPEKYFIYGVLSNLLELTQKAFFAPAGAAGGPSGSRESSFCSGRRQRPEQKAFHMNGYEKRERRISFERIDQATLAWY